MYVIFTDTDTDITLKKAKEYGYNLISMPYTAGDKDVFPYVDFEEFDYESFYNMLKTGVMPTTSAISVEKYISYFEPLFAEGKDILYVHFSAAMTMTFDNMKKAVDALKEKYPERKFYAIDTKGITIGSLNIVYEVGDMYKAGKSAEEIMKWAETEVDKFAVYFFAEDLKFFKRSGRVSGVTATMGNLLGIRPIIHMNSEGKMVNVGKEKGRAKALQRLVSYVEELGDDIKNHRIIVAHSGALSVCEELKKLIIEKFGDDLTIETVVVNPTAGSHCGPGCIGVSFHAIHR